MGFDAGSAVGKLLLDTKGFTDGAKDAENSGNKIKSAFAGIKNAAVQLGRAALEGLISSVKAADEFGKAFGNVSTLVDTAVVDVGAMADELLGLDSRLGSSIDLTEGLYQALSASVEPAEAVKFVGEAAKFAQAALIDTNKAVDVITTGLNSYGLAADQAGVFSDKLFSVIKLGKTTGKELASSLGKVIPIAANMGISFDELGASIAVMTRQGIKTSEATTQLNSVISAFLKPSDDMVAVLDKLGFASGQAAIDQLGFKGAIDAVTESTGGSKAELAKLFRNTRALRGAVALTGEGAKDFAGILDEVTNSAGTTNEAFEKQELTFDTLKNAVEKIQIKLGQELLPIIYGLVEGFTDFIDGSDDSTSSIEGFNVVLDVLGGALKLIVNVGKAVFGAIGQIAKQFKQTDAVAKALNKTLEVQESVFEKQPEKIAALKREFGALKTAQALGVDVTFKLKKVTSELNDLLPTTNQLVLDEASSYEELVKQLDATQKAEERILLLEFKKKLISQQQLIRDELDQVGESVRRLTEDSGFDDLRDIISATDFKGMTASTRAQYEENLKLLTSSKEMAGLLEIVNAGMIEGVTVQDLARKSTTQLLTIVRGGFGAFDGIVTKYKRATEALKNNTEQLAENEAAIEESFTAVKAVVEKTEDDVAGGLKAVVADVEETVKQSAAAAVEVLRQLTVLAMFEAQKLKSAEEQKLQDILNAHKQIIPAFIGVEQVKQDKLDEIREAAKDNEIDRIDEIEQESILTADSILGAFSSAFSILGEGLFATAEENEDLWERFKVAALGGVASLVEAFAQQWALQAAAALIPGLTFNPLAAAGWASLSAGAFVAAGAIRGLEGGGVADGMTLVGERGPELINVGEPSRVFPAQETARMSGGGVVINNTFNVRNENEAEIVSRKIGRQTQAIAKRI